MEKQSVLIVRASSEESATEEEQKYEEYEVEIEQPYGLRFAKGRDGGTYIDAIAPGGNADKTKMFTVGDKVVATRYSMKCLTHFSCFLLFVLHVVDGFTTGFHINLWIRCHFVSVELIENVVIKC